MLFLIFWFKYIKTFLFLFLEALHEDDVLNELLQNGNFSEIEDSDQDDEDFKTNNLFKQIEDEYLDDEEHDFQAMVERPPFSSAFVIQLSPDIRTLDNSHQKKPVSAFTTKSLSTPNSERKRIWKQVPFENKQHYYTSLPTKPVRRPIDYFRDYFDDAFLEKVSYCTNLHYFRTNGLELKCTGSEIAKVFAIHMIMGCIPYPRLFMYWKAGTKLGLISDVMSRDRFLTIRNALHVIETDSPPDHEKENPLWKVQPMINKVKDTCNRLERSPGFYAIDKKIIPFSGRCKLRQTVKHKVVGLKNFVLTTSEGLILDFAIYKDAKFFEETNLGLGPAIILHLAKSIPSGSCVYFDRYFTTVPLIEEMEKLNLHATGTIMQNQISNQTTIKFNKDFNMDCGESQQFVCEPVTVVKWKDNKSVIIASNCTGVDETINVKRWDKSNKRYTDVAVPKIVHNYNQHIMGAHVLDQQLEYYRTFNKTKKWTLKVIMYFLDLALVNSWRLYSNDCTSNNFVKNQTMPLLDFLMDVADTLSSTPERTRIEEDDDNYLSVAHQDHKKYRRAIAPSAAKRHDGYEHYPISDDIKAPRACRMENCSSRSKMRCEKCDVYLCLSRDKNCFKNYHKSST